MKMYKMFKVTNFRGVSVTNLAQCYQIIFSKFKKNDILQIFEELKKV